ncbi:MAG: ROK family protein [Gemmataceae bacterium]
MYLGIEIGGTKLQLGVGDDSGTLVARWQGSVDAARGAEGIREQIVAALPHLPIQKVRRVGIGFGGPVDDHTRTVIKSHQIAGWEDFPLADWISELVGKPAVLGNDSDVAGLAEARHGAGKGESPLFYMNIGTGIGGALILDGQIYRGVGRGAAEIGHLIVSHAVDASLTLESLASGPAIARMASQAFREPLTAEQVAQRALAGLPHYDLLFDNATHHLATALCHVITLLCPRRIVIGGGVAQVGERLLFEPLRRKVAEQCFAPFRGLTQIVPAALGQEVVVHGAIALAALSE